LGRARLKGLPSLREAACLPRAQTCVTCHHGQQTGVLSTEPETDHLDGYNPKVPHDVSTQPPTTELSGHTLMPRVARCVPLLSRAPSAQGLWPGSQPNE